MIRFVASSVTDKTPRSPFRLCCVVDVSGSMGTAVEVQAVEGAPKERTGLTQLDLVKHALHTIVECGTDEDEFALVSFSSSAQPLLAFTPLTKLGKQKAITQIKTLSEDGMTNLYHGLQVGMSMFESKKKLRRR